MLSMVFLLLFFPLKKKENQEDFVYVPKVLEDLRNVHSAVSTSKKVAAGCKTSEQSDRVRTAYH